jgi:hypothetical protein
MAYSFSDSFLCLDHCHGRCLCLVEQMKKIYKFKLYPLLIRNRSFNNQGTD